MNTILAMLLVMRLSFYTTDGLTQYDEKYITRSGRELSPTSVAVDPKLIGWDMHQQWCMAIPELSAIDLPTLRTVDDTGGLVVGPVVDVFLPEGNWKELIERVGESRGYYSYVTVLVSDNWEMCRKWAFWGQNRPEWVHLVLEQEKRDRDERQSPPKNASSHSSLGEDHRPLGGPTRRLEAGTDPSNPSRLR